MEINEKENQVKGSAKDYNNTWNNAINELKKLFEKGKNVSQIISNLKDKQEIKSADPTKMSNIKKEENQRNI